MIYMRSLPLILYLYIFIYFEEINDEPGCACGWPCAATLYLGPTIEIIMARPDLLIVNIFPWVGGAGSNLFLYIRLRRGAQMLLNAKRK